MLYISPVSYILFLGGVGCEGVIMWWCLRLEVVLCSNRYSISMFERERGYTRKNFRTFEILEFTYCANERYCIIHDYWNSCLGMSGKGSLFTILYLLYHCRVSFWTGVFCCFCVLSISKVPSNIFMWLAQGDVSLTNIRNPPEGVTTFRGSQTPQLPWFDKPGIKKSWKSLGKM